MEKDEMYRHDRNRKKNVDKSVAIGQVYRIGRTTLSETPIQSAGLGLPESKATPKQLKQSKKGGLS